MAFTTYPYPGYQPYYGQPVPDQLAQLRQQQMQPQMMQPVPQQMQPQPVPAPAGPQNNGIIWVGSKQEADSYLVAPGSAVALWDSNNPVIYLRQADSTGKPSTKVYDLVERMENQATAQNVPQPDLSRYITREELEDILAERLKRPARATKPKEEAENG